MLEVYSQLAGPNAKSLAELFVQVDTEFADIAPIMKLPEPKRTLHSFFEEAAAVA